MISSSAFEYITTAQKAYADTIFKEFDILHVYGNLEVEFNKLK
ncbi:hypothetical protein [Pseudoneobacillus sp. C159]